MKAIIIGAGIGGLTAAIALQTNGIQVEVYEQAPEARAVGAGLTLWANAIRALQQIDADDALATSIMDVSGTIRRWDGLTLSAFDLKRFKQRYDTPIIGIHREDLMYGLLAKAGNVVQFDKKLARYEQDAAAVHVHFEDGSTAHGDLLIGTDGIRSTVRRQMQPTSQPIYRGYAAWRGVISFPHQQVGTMWGEIWGHGARFGIVPLNKERLYWFATANRPANTPPADHKAVLQQLFGTWHHPIPQIIKATPDASVLYNDIADLEPLKTWRDGRVVLLGDAAHAMTPNMGQGACQAIEDAVVLGRVCGQYSTVHEALKRYEADRLAHTSRVILRSRMIGRIGQITHPLGVALRDGMMRVMPARMSAQQFDFVLSKAL